MKNAFHIICSLVALVVFSLALAACVAQGPSSTSASSPSEASSGVAISASTDSSSATDTPTPQSNSSHHWSSSSSEESGVAVDDDDGSYAENHLTDDAYNAPNIEVDRNGTYTDKDHVALYIHTFGTVPKNYVTKTKARKAGWVNTKGNLWDVLPGMSIGGGGFYNDDGMLPDAPGREWFECDIDYEGGYRNAKRIVYSDDGLVYYTNDHYKTFQRLY